MYLLLLLIFLKDLYSNQIQVSAVEPEAAQSQFRPLIESNIIYSTKLLPEANSVSNYPVRVIVEGTSINLPVKPASVTENAYQFYQDAVSFLETSAYPGEVGNMVLYAHNEADLFAELQRVEAGKIIEVDSADNKHRYHVTETKLVNPDQVEVIAPTNDERLTLLTCFGDDKSQRLVVVAKPIASFADFF
jgi:LPXTG-site transpeptidase (sortase) family protein